MPPTSLFYYDFRLNNKSPAIGKAAPLTDITDNRLGNPRSADASTMGCYETAVPVDDDSEQ